MSREPHVNVVVGLLWHPDEQRVLMMRRHAGLQFPNTLRPGMWEYAGGKVEDGEAEAAALIREWREEIGLKIDVFPGLLASFVLRAERRYLVSLYEVYLVEKAQRERFFSTPLDQHPVSDRFVGAAEGQDLAWVEPTEAVRTWTLVPSCYAFYEAVLRNRLMAGHPKFGAEAIRIRAAQQAELLAENA